MGWKKKKEIHIRMYYKHTKRVSGSKGKVWGIECIAILRSLVVLSWNLYSFFLFLNRETPFTASRLYAAIETSFLDFLKTTHSCKLSMIIVVGIYLWFACNLVPIDILKLFYFKSLVVQMKPYIHYSYAIYLAWPYNADTSTLVSFCVTVSFFSID